MYLNINASVWRRKGERRRLETMGYGSYYGSSMNSGVMAVAASGVLAILAVLCFLSVILIRRRVFHE